MMMKHLHIRLLLLLCTGTFVAGCEDDDPSGFANTVYITAAEVNNYTTLSVEPDTGGELAVSVKSPELADHPVEITLAVDNSLVDAYNKSNNTGYSVLPGDSYKLTNSNITINPGANISNDEALLQILSTDSFKEGQSYLAPVTIRNAGGADVLEASKTLYVEIKPVVITTVASLAGNTYFKVDFSKNSAKVDNLSQVTMECRVKANAFQSSSPFISSVMGIEEHFLIRFGDVTVEPNQLQVAGGASATNVAMSFATDTWYHLAAVYNGSELKVYVDGNLEATTAVSRDFNLSNNFFFGKSTSQGRYLHGSISEARIWSRPLSQAEITNGMCGVPADSEGLLGYWKFNEGEGNVAHDISGNGFDATAHRYVIWHPNVRCE